MKRVLSIDLDYIMKPSIEKYELSDDVFHYENPSLRWSNFFEFSGITSNNLDIDVSNLMYCYKVFLEAIKSSKSVSFGYDHDAILFSIEDYEDISLINIDHHDDFLSGRSEELDHKILESTGASRVIEYEHIIKSNYVHEGNWIGWLSLKNKLKDFVWISNENSSNKGRNEFIKTVFPKYKCLTKDEFKFSTFEFDHVFVCLSPQYISPQHWHYFSMFMVAYEQITGNSSSERWISDEKYEMKHRYKNATDLIQSQIKLVAYMPKELTPEEQMARYEDDLKETDWGHQPC